MSNIIINFTNNLFRSSGRLFAIFFLLILALKWPFFSIPPVWDEAFSIFPAADFLVNHGFDYSLLLTQPHYHDGGPTAHALSLLTLVAALVLKITGGGTWAWVILHISQWLMTAAIGTMLTRIYSKLFDELQAFLLAIATLIYPLMLAQLGGMYIEVPLLFFSLLAFQQYRSDRIWLASLFLVAASMTKESGVIAVGALSMSALCGQSKTTRKRFEEAFILALPAITFVLIKMSHFDFALLSSTSHKLGDILQILIYRNLSVYQDYISHIPELIVIVAASVVTAISLLSSRTHQYNKNRQEQALIVIYNSLFIIMFLLFHFVVFAYMQSSDRHFLTRYFFYVIPSMFFVIYYAVDKMIEKTGAKEILLLIIIGVCLINRSGILYPPIPYSSIAMAERSEEYIDGYKVQKEYTRMIEKQVSKDVPVYVSLPDYFLTHYSVSQYVSKPLPNVYYIGHVLKVTGNKFKYPDHFVLVYNYPWMGGAYIKGMLQDISGNKEFSFEVLGQFQKGYFSASVLEIKKR
ncbi:MAG: hypothetical protein A2169_04225 [Deltaproteobacteria bacterium RBG_13_47_9]|nr:MAG: hypothetical protein A2169_04225 [Deltaproteobacteria bacterium RBG_13_47_9]